MSSINNSSKALEDYSYEELAHALYVKGKREGFAKVTDKTKWRELITADKLGHTAFPKISAGKDSDKYGADARDDKNNINAEYKSKALEEKDLRNLLCKPKPKGGSYASLKVGGVYNGAYKDGAIEKYAQIDHYFSVFYEEKCILIIKVETDFLIKTLKKNLEKSREEKKIDPNKTSNLNTVTVDLEDTSKYETAFKDNKWFSDKELNDIQ